MAQFKIQGVNGEVETVETAEALTRSDRLALAGVLDTNPAVKAWDVTATHPDELRLWGWTSVGRPFTALR